MSFMSNGTNAKLNEITSEINPENSVLFRTLKLLLLPLARLCLANGITFAAAEEVLKRAFVEEANAMQPGAPEHGKVSRISTVTGINRREVTRITTSKTSDLATKRPLASEVLARWTTDPTWRDREGKPLAIKRQGATLSFETLAQSITRDVHPRSILDELIRLELVIYDERHDHVILACKDYVPKNDCKQMFNFLGDNVGDHLNAAVANVLHDGNSHLEQAVFADELSAESLERFLPVVMTYWNELHEKVVPALTSLIVEDKHAGRARDKRIRIGLYTFTDVTRDSTSSLNSQPARRFRKSASKENSI